MKHAELIVHNAGLGHLKNNGLSVDTLKTILKTKKFLKNQISENEELQREVMKKFDVKADDDGGFNYSKHEKKLEIIADLEIILNGPVDGGYKIPDNFLHFITMKEIMESTKDLQAEVISMLEPFIITD